MLFALLSSLLPFCSITAGGTTNKVSGIGIVKMGAKLGAEYIKEGTIENDYKVADGLTWGDIKAGADFASQHKELRQAAVVLVIAFLPLVFLFFAMMFTFFATGKISMILPTLFTLLTVLENVFIIGVFPSVQKLIFGQAGGITITLLIGIYALTILAGIALAILLLLWITGGFNRPEAGERGYDEKEKKKKSRFSRSDKKRKKNRRKRKSSRKRKKKVTKESSSTQESKSQEKQPQKEQQQQEQPQQEQAPVAAAGHVSGLTGMYQGTSLDLSTSGNSTFTIGTTPEAKDIIQNGNVAEAHKLQNSNCVITYHAESRQYTIVNHSDQNIILQTGSSSQAQLCLKQGQGASVGGNTLLFIGDLNNMIKLD